MTFAGLPLWMLLAGLIPLIAGIIILYLLRRTPRPHLVSDVDFWMRAVQAAKPRTLLAKRLPLFSLLLTLLIALLLWLSSGEPRFGEELEGLSIVVINAGHTMQVEEEGLTRKERALELATRWVDQATSEGEVVVIRAGVRPSVILPKTVDRAVFEQVRRDFFVDDGAADLDGAMRLADLVAREHSSTQSAEGPRTQIFVVGDRAPDVRSETPAVFVPVGGRANSVAVTRLVARRDPNAVGEYTVLAEVTSFSEAAAITRLTITDRDTTILEQVVELSPGEIRAFTANGFSSVEGQLQASLSDTEITDGEDALELDDRAYALAPALAVHRVLLVADDSPFFEAALSVHHAIQSDRRPISDLGSLGADELSGYDAVLVDGGELSQPLPHRAVLYMGTRGAGFDAGDTLSGPEVTASLSAHPALSGIRFESSRISESRALLPAPGDRVLVRNHQNALGLAREQDGRRALAMGFLLSETNLGERPLFPLFIHHALTWLRAEPEPALSTRLPGEAISVEDGIAVLGPDDQPREVIGGLVHDTEAQGFYFPGERAFAVTAAPGFGPLPAPHEHVAFRGTHALWPLTLIVGFIALFLLLLEWGLLHRGRLS